jgi:Tfp pilus assembly protein PilF
MLEAWAAYLGARVSLRTARAKAAACARKQADADPRAAQPHTILGRLYLEDGDASAAAREFELALKRDPSDAEAQKGLAAVRQKSGQA